ncbi:MAG: hypothetical protein ACJ8CZ_04285, partial [Microvirga sp.]
RPGGSPVPNPFALRWSGEAHLSPALPSISETSQDRPETASPTRGGSVPSWAGLLHEPSCNR